MALKEGLYHIRFVPVSVQPPFKGGLFATATEFGEPILAEAEQAKEPQVWRVQHQDNGKYVITQPGFKTKLPGIGPVLFGWSLANPSEAAPGGNILLKVDFAELDIEPTGKGENLMYSVKVPNPQGTHSAQLNFDFYVTERDHTLTSQLFLSGLRFGRPHPHWQFIPVDK